MSIPGWSRASIRELTTKVGSGSTPRGGESAYHSAGTPLIRSKNVVFFGFKRKGLVYLDESQAALLRGAEVKANDVLLNITGASIGRVTLAPPDLAGARVNQHVCVIRPNPAIDPRFLSAYLSSPELQNSILEENYGVTRQALTKEQILAFDIPVAPVGEQVRIADKLDSILGLVNSCRERLDRVPDILQRFRQSVLAAATSGELTSEWRDRQGLRDWLPSTVEGVASIIFDGPFGSNLKTEDYTDFGVRVVRLENIAQLQFLDHKQTYISEEKFGGLRRHALETDDVLFSSFVSEEVRVCLVPDHISGLAINKADCFCVRVNTDLCRPLFLAMHLSSPSTFAVLDDAIHGATRPRINLTQLRGLLVNLPSLQEQDEICLRVTNLFELGNSVVARAEDVREQLGQITAGVLTKAFSGELVPQDPNDEPAAKLLAEVLKASENRVSRKR